MNHADSAVTLSKLNLTALKIEISFSYILKLKEMQKNLVMFDK